MTRLRPVAAVSAAGVVVAVIIGLASPASAVAGPAITVDSPAANEVLTGQPTISGRAAPDFGYTIDKVTVSLTSPTTSDLPAPWNDRTASFSWSPSLSWNGPYRARVVAKEVLVLGLGEATSEATVSFRMEIPPANPEGVRAEANPDRTVRVTWARNGEPDMIAYRVQRKDAGASTFHDVGGAVPQPSSGSAVSIADPATAAGGTFTYQVQAIRAGRSGDASTAVGSGFSATQVVLPALAAGPPGEPGKPPPPDGPPQNAAPTPNLSAFLKGSGALPTASVPQAPSIPDGTFSENLPFATPPAAKGGRAGAIGLSADPAANSARAVLIPVAGGILLCLVAFHVRRFNRWLVAPEGGEPGRRPAARRQVTESLPVVATTESDPDPPSGAPPAPTPVPAPNWLLGIGHKADGDGIGATAAAGRPRGEVKPKQPPVSLEYWSVPPATAAKADPAPDDHPDDDSLWAPLTPSPFVAKAPRVRADEAPSDDAWDDVLVKPGAGRSHPA